MRLQPMMRLRPVAMALAACLAVCLGGCTVVVSGPPPTSVACRWTEAGDPCRELGDGFRCSSADPAVPGTCERTDCVPELCNDLLDNDCDGQIDEGVDDVVLEALVALGDAARF